MKIEITTITQAARHRTVDTVKVKELADSISSIGLINPITVSPENRLIAGAHRLEAAKKLGWTDIECTVLDTTELTAELAEIDENLIRNELSECELRIKRLEIENLQVQIKLCKKYDLLRLLRELRDAKIEYGSHIYSPLKPHERESLTERRAEILKELDSRKEVK